MKIAIKFMLCISVLSLSSCLKTEKGSIDITGYVYGCCGSNLPEENATLMWGLGGEDLVTTTTDANGYFRLKGDYDTRALRGKMMPLIRMRSKNSAVGDKELASNMPNKSNLDTIYIFNATNFKVAVSDPKAVSTDQDTVYIYDVDECAYTYPFKDRNNYKYTKKVAGPFTHNAEIGTFRMEILNPHVGYGKSTRSQAWIMMYYFKGNDLEPSAIISDTIKYNSMQKNTVCREVNSYTINAD